MSNLIGAALSTLAGLIGVTTTTTLGEVTALQIGRYARAIGESDPVFFDETYARSRNFASVIAPPNFLPAVVDWTQGAAEDELRLDGTPVTHLPGVSAVGLRLMGGGQRLEFQRPVVAGERVVRHSTLSEAKPRETRGGPLIVATYLDVYETETGEVLLTCVRSILIRIAADT